MLKVSLNPRLRIYDLWSIGKNANLFNICFCIYNSYLVVILHEIIDIDNFNYKSKPLSLLFEGHLSSWLHHFLSLAIMGHKGLWYRVRSPRHLFFGDPLVFLVFFPLISVQFLVLIGPMLSLSRQPIYVRLLSHPGVAHPVT